MSAASEGYVDFVGYPVGSPSPVLPARVAFRGLLDFVGYPAAQPNSVPVLRGGAAAVGGKHRVRFLLEQMRNDSMLNRFRRVRKQEVFDGLALASLLDMGQKLLTENTYALIALEI